MESNKQPLLPKIKPVKPGCLSPFTLFQPVPTLQAENMTYIEYLMGILTQINQLISTYNQVTDVLDDFDNRFTVIDGRLTDLTGEVEDLSNQFTELGNDFTELRQSVETFKNQVAQELLKIVNSIQVGDAATLEKAKAYTNLKISELPESGGGSGCKCGQLTAGEYDSLGLEAVDYDDVQMTAKEYDTKARFILLGCDGAVYLRFANSVEVDANKTVFAFPPSLNIKPGRRYLVELSLGSFGLNGEAPAHLEIVGSNTLGQTLPISVPSGGTTAVAVIWNTVPSEVRGMSDQSKITGTNAFIKIKPLGEL